MTVIMICTNRSTNLFFCLLQLRASDYRPLEPCYECRQDLYHRKVLAELLFPTALYQKRKCQLFNHSFFSETFKGACKLVFLRIETHQCLNLARCKKFNIEYVYLKPCESKIAYFNMECII